MISGQRLWCCIGFGTGFNGQVRASVPCLLLGLFYRNSILLAHQYLFCLLVNHAGFDDVKKNLLDKGGECESCISWWCRKEITWLSSSKRGRMWMYEYMNFDDAKEESNKAASTDKHLLQD